MMKQWADNLGLALRAMVLPDSVRSQPINVYSQEYAELFGGTQPTASGAYVTEERALAFSAVYRCVSLIAGTLASMPVCVSKWGEKGPKRLDNHYVDYLLNVAPNEEQNPGAVKEFIFTYALLWGTGYAEVLMDEDYYPTGLRPIRTSRVEPDRDKSGKLYYKIYDEGGRGSFEVRDPSQMFVIPNISLDGVTGMSTVALAREGIGLGLEAEAYGSGYFGNGQVPAGVLTTKEKLPDPVRANMRASWREQYAGARNRGEIAILEMGTEFKPIAIPPEDAQFLGTREFQIVEICRWFGVSPYMLGVMKGAGSIDIEAMGDEFKTYTLLPWVRKFNEEARRKLIMPRERTKTFVWMDTVKVLRAGFERRIKAHSVAINSGLRPINECRAEEEWEPLPQPEADIALIPLNLGQGGPNNEPKGPVDEGDTKQRTSQDKPGGLGAL